MKKMIFLLITSLMSLFPVLAQAHIDLPPECPAPEVLIKKFPMNHAEKVGSRERWFVTSNKISNVFQGVTIILDNPKISSPAEAIAIANAIEESSTHSVERISADGKKWYCYYAMKPAYIEQGYMMDVRSYIQAKS